MRKLKFYDELYIGERVEAVEHNKGLAFMTPKTNDKNFEKRKKTVDDWCKTDLWNADTQRYRTVQGRSWTEKNNPISGFRVGDTNKRWSTSNKLFIITDPRDFKLEISAENMAYIIQNCLIDKGEIKDELIWARDMNTNWLVKIDHPDYQDRLKISSETKDGNKPKAIKYEVGDFVKKGSYRENVKYLGKKYIAFLSSRTTNHNSLSARSYHNYSTSTEYTLDIIPEKHHVYLIKHVYHDKEYYYTTTTKSKVPVYEMGEPFDIAENTIGKSTGIHGYRVVITSDKPIRKEDYMTEQLKEIYEKYR